MTVDRTITEVSEFPHPNPGAAFPVLTTDDERTQLSYEICERDGGGRAVLDFDLSFTVSMGWPNDEALAGHRLFKFGLSPYSILEVSPSDLIEQMEFGNRVHPRHSAGSFENLRHMIVTFKDSTFECVFSNVSLSRNKGALS